jgi:hypothetical protein
MSLRPGATEKRCVLVRAHLSELCLPAQFLIDLAATLPALNQTSLAQDVLQGAMPRENLNRALHGDPAKLLSPTHSFAILTTLLLRRGVAVKPCRGNRRRLLPSERLAIRRLLYHYGVRCARRSCCRLAHPRPSMHPTGGPTHAPAPL